MTLTIGFLVGCTMIGAMIADIVVMHAVKVRAPGVVLLGIHGHVVRQGTDGEQSDVDAG